MFKYLFSEKLIDIIVGKISKEVNLSLKTIESSQNQKLDKILNNVEALRLEVSTIEKRIESKEVQDKMNYGQLKYQISSIENKIKNTRSKINHEVSSH